MELMVVVTIIGIVAAFGVPNYAKAIDKALARDMVNNLRVIAAAQESFRYAGGTGEYFYVSGLGDANQDQLNTNLMLNLISQKGVIYSCKTSMLTPSSGCICYADYPARWKYQIMKGALSPNWDQITCASGACPAGVP